MKKYKNNEEAAKAYADLLQLDTNTEQGKLQYESACLDFSAGANWKDEQLRLSNISKMLPDSEAVKEWYQILIGKGEEEMKEHIKLWFGWKSLENSGLDKPFTEL